MNNQYMYKWYYIWGSEESLVSCTDCSKILLRKYIVVYQTGIFDNLLEITTITYDT